MKEGRHSHSMSVIDPVQCDTTIQSPNYPDNYPDNQHQVRYQLLLSMLRICILQLWFLSVEAGSQLNLTFHSFSLEEPDYYDDFCSWDYVEISYDGYGERFCGDNIPDPIITPSGSSMTVKFSSDSGVNATGFNATWEIL